MKDVKRQQFTAVYTNTNIEIFLYNLTYNIFMFYMYILYNRNTKSKSIQDKIEFKMVFI